MRNCIRHDKALLALDALSFAKGEDGSVFVHNPIQGKSQMAQLIRARDWGSTALGSLSSWSQELVAVLNVVLASPVPMFLYLQPDCLTVYNDAALPIVSHKHPLALGMPASSVFAEAWETVGSEVNSVLNHGLILRHESVLIPLERDGRLQDLYWDYCYSPIFEDGEISGVLCIVQDVTSARLAREERDAVAARLTQVLDSTTDSILMVDRDWRVQYMNPKALHDSGPLSNAVGKNFWEAFPGTIFDGSPYQVEYPRAMHERTAADFEAFYPEPLNIWFAVQVRPTDEGIVVFFRDVTEQKRATAALMQAEKLAAVGRLAASIAHEINNPLESVTNLLFLARGSTNLDEVHEYLDTAERELRRVAVISNQTLRFYKQSTNPHEVRCDELFGNTMSIYQGRLLNARVRVEKRKRARHPVTCFDDEIRQVLSNLVGNAIDAMQASGGRLLLRSRESTDWRTGRRGLSLTIADTGEGISPQTRKRMFDAFYTTKGIGGTGLGLWVSQEIVERHHGTLRVRSSQQPGHSGTVFTLFLPFDPVLR